MGTGLSARYCNLGNAIAYLKEQYAVGAHHAGAQQLFIDIPNIHPALPILIQRYCLQPVFTCVRMYWGNMLHLDVERIFGVTTLELG